MTKTQKKVLQALYDQSSAASILECLAEIHLKEADKEGDDEGMVAVIERESEAIKQIGQAIAHCDL